MKQFNKLIFVDADDTCRAPMSKIIMKSKHLLGELEIESRGMVVLFPEPMNQKAEAVLISKNYPTKEHTSKQLVQEDFTEDTLVLTMEEQYKEKIWTNFENAKNVYTLPEYIQVPGEVVPLFGEPLPSYGQCYEVLELLIGRLVVQLNEEEMLGKQTSNETRQIEE